MLGWERMTGGGKSGELQVVLVPIALGAWLNHSMPNVMRRLSPFAPLVAASMTVLVSASIISQNAAAVQAAGLRLLSAVFCLHLGVGPLLSACSLLLPCAAPHNQQIVVPLSPGGFVLGYGLSRLLGIPEKQARTNSIEVGMQVSRLSLPKA